MIVSTSVKRRGHSTLHKGLMMAATSALITAGSNVFSRAVVDCSPSKECIGYRLCSRHGWAHRSSFGRPGSGLAHFSAREKEANRRVLCSRAGQLPT